MIKETASPACFFTCFAAFFSFGESKACFFEFLLDCCDLDMVLTPDQVDMASEVRGEAESRGGCPNGPRNPALLNMVRHPG